MKSILMILFILMSVGAFLTNAADDATSMQQQKPSVPPAVSAQPMSPTAPPKNVDGMMGGDKNFGGSNSMGNAPINPTQALEKSLEKGNVEESIDEAIKLRDPFQPPDRARAKPSVTAELESIAIEGIKLLGVVTGPKQTSALISANGKSYFLNLNSKVGPRKGVVRLITPKGLIIRERIINVLGREENVDTKIYIESDKKGGA